MHEFEDGDLKSESGHKVTDLEEVRDAGLKVSRRKASHSTTSEKKTMRKNPTRTSEA